MDDLTQEQREKNMQRIRAAHIGAGHYKHITYKRMQGDSQKICWTV